MTFKKPIGMNYIIGSATTYLGKPPSFNVIELDPVTMLPVYFETYAFDLVHANKYDDPKWDLKYNYTETYNLPDLSPQSFLEHSELMFRNETAAIQYRNHRYIDGPGQNPTDPCDRKCMMEMYCQTVSNDYDEYMFCRDDDKADLSLAD